MVWLGFGIAFGAAVAGAVVLALEGHPLLAFFALLIAASMRVHVD